MFKWDDNRMMDNNDISVGFMLGVSISDPELVSVAAPWHHLTIYSRHLVLCSTSQVAAVGHS